VDGVRENERENKKNKVVSKVIRKKQICQGVSHMKSKVKGSKEEKSTINNVRMVENIDIDRVLECVQVT